MEDIVKIETITPETAGTILHKNAEFVRAGLRQGRFPFGTAVQSESGQWNYLIIKSKFLDYIGIERREEDEKKILEKCN